MNRVRIKRKNKPFKHYLVSSSSKKIHGWFSWPKRECTQERFLLNPYNGCGLGCFYCYTRALPGYFKRFHYQGDIFVFEDFDKEVAKQLDKLDIGFCGYLSPVTEPFGKINRYYNLSEKLIETFVERNLPIEFITKEKIPQKVIELIKKQEHSFGQVSILTLDSKINRVLSAGAHPLTLLDNLERLNKSNIYSVCRIDPILPFITDNKDSLKQILFEVKKRGVNHIITSVLDIPPRLKNFILDKVGYYFGQDIKERYLSLYREKIGYLHADINYRKDLFNFIGEQAKSLDMSYALCMEYEIDKETVIGLNKEFSTSESCEGLNVPVYKRRGDKFYPQKGCSGNCLSCQEPLCGVEELAYRKTKSPLSLKYKDYRNFSKRLKS